MGRYSLGGGGRFAAYVASHGGGAKGRKAAIEHCHATYGKAACDAMHKHGTKAAPQARAAHRKIMARRSGK